ncbi:MAG TPA: SDR family oxidoreductase [Candidatus Saccharimonadales bacterium]|nr:SDR family oxidoreductase [Candidatus Saccharimonadales bacterium]
MSKVVVITAASKGIGAATALAFGKAGYDVVLNYKNDTAAAKAVVRKIDQLGQKAIMVQADVFTPAGIDTLFAEVAKHFPKIDVFVNNAADPSEPKFGDYTLQDVASSLNANFGATVLCTQAAAQLMETGCILFVSSIYGLPFAGNPSLILYSASKAAMINFAQTTAEKLAPKIRCNVVAPGTTRTPSWDGVADEYVQTSLGMTLQKEWVEPEEIADALVFLAATPHITAQTITVDAGWQKKIRPVS